MPKVTSYQGSISTYLVLFLAGCLLVFIGFGLTSGLLKTWINDRFGKPIASPSAAPIATYTPSPSPTSKPKTTYIPADEYVPNTTKGGIVLGASTENTGYKYATLVYDYRVDSSSPWLIRASYDTRYNTNLIMEEVSRSYERRITICYYPNSGSTCESGNINPGTYNFAHPIAGKTLTYQIVGDSHGPKIILSSVYYVDDSKCLKLVSATDDISPDNKLQINEKLDDNDWRELHFDYCVNNDSGTHTYHVKAVDEAGNSTEVSSVY
jgi:hypothetical protein